MNEHEFVQRVEQLAGLSSREAVQHAIFSTLETLAERVGADPARHLSYHLPEQLRPPLLKHSVGTPGVPFALDEFFNRVARREHCTVTEVVRRVRAVTEVIKEAIPPRGEDELFEQLPADYQQLFDAAPRHASSSGLW